ncbi:unnamed protein product [Spodoptera exigua]|nr:unnamed protein product [Spodoptera exigua]
MPLVPQDVRGVSTRAMSEAQRVREEGAAAQTSDAEAKPVQVDLLLQLQQMMAEQARRQEEQARRQEEQARRQEEQARCQAEQLRELKEEQARRQEEQARRQEEQARCQAEQLRELKEDQARRQEDQARRQEEQARRLEEMHKDFTKGLQKAVERVQEVEEGLGKLEHRVMAIDERVKEEISKIKQEDRTKNELTDDMVNWAFLARFCFLSLEGQFEYLIEYDKDAGIPNLLLYYDDDTQWPSVYHSSKTCKQREEVLNRAGQNQIIRLSHWYPDTEYSGCIITKHNKELPAAKSTTTTKATEPPVKKPKNSTKLTPPEPSYYDQFLKTTTRDPKAITDPNTNTTWFELQPTDGNFTTMTPEDELWESIAPGNGSHFGNLKDDVEILFENGNRSGHKIKRSLDLYERYRRRRLNAEPKALASQSEKEHLVVSCHNSRRFRSARERWWFIAISNCESNKARWSMIIIPTINCFQGLDIRYKFLMTNGPDGDFWHEHFSADEFYVLPVLLAYTIAYVVVMIAVVMCSVELKSRHLLHSTYKLFLMSVVSQHSGVMLQSLAYIRYAANGFGTDNAKIVGQFLCGLSEMSFLLLLVLMAKGYTITRGRLKVGFTVRLTVFMCCYIVTYIVLFIYQAKAFDPGEVLYLYESPAGYGLIVLRILAWCMFAYSTFFTVRKYPEKNIFYCPFFICGTLWFYAGPLFILTANTYIDKWVRESVVTAVLLFISFCGHIMFLLLTLPVFANKNFPYHVRTTQIGVMEVTGNAALDGFGPNAYHPTNAAPQTVIIPLTRRTEELIGNMYNQYMATAPPLTLEDQPPKLKNIPKRIDSISPKHRLISQDSTDTNSSGDIKPIIQKDEPTKEIFTVENQISKMEPAVLPVPKPVPVLPERNLEDINRGDLPNVMRSRRNMLEPIKREDNVPSWSLAKGPCVVGMLKKTKNVEEGLYRVKFCLLNLYQTQADLKYFGKKMGRAVWSVRLLLTKNPLFLLLVWAEVAVPHCAYPATPAEHQPLRAPSVVVYWLFGNTVVTSQTPHFSDSPELNILTNGRKVPPVRNGLQSSSGEISTIMEGRVQSYPSAVSKATIDLFSVGSHKG